RLGLAGRRQGRCRVHQRRARARLREGRVDARPPGRHAGPAPARSPAEVKGVARVELRKRLERTIRGGDPWVYRDALAGAPRLPDGALVRLTTRNGSPLAVGFWDAASPIAVRIIGEASADAKTVVGGRIAAALARRLAFIDRRETDT